MARTISGHEALQPGDDRLQTGTVPGTKVKLTTRAAMLPLFLDLARRLNKRVKPLSTKDTWSYAYRPPRLGNGWSDHCGYAIDAWSSTIGSQSTPTSMTAQQARAMSEILETYRTHDGHYVFGWGTRTSNPGVTFGGITYNGVSDPMHVFVAPGVTVDDVQEVRKRMGIKADGTRR